MVMWPLRCTAVPIAACRPETPLDKEAQQRSTSTYLVQRVIPMLPHLLCERLCSLNPGASRLVAYWLLSMQHQHPPGCSVSFTCCLPCCASV